MLPSASRPWGRALANRSKRQGCSGSVLALAERHVGDFAKAGSIVVQRADMAPIYLIGAAAEVVSAVCLQPRRHGVDLGLGGDECVQRGIVSLGRDCPRVSFGNKRAGPSRYGKLFSDGISVFY
jgi:hypothetical protein